MPENLARRLGDTLGLTDHMRAGWVGLPARLSMLTLARALARSELVTRGRDLSSGPFDLIHIFSTSHGVLEVELPEARKRLDRAGAIWVSWPSPEAGMPTDLNTAAIEELARETVLRAAEPAPLDDRWTAIRLTLPPA